MQLRQQGQDLVAAGSFRHHGPAGWGITLAWEKRGMDRMTAGCAIAGCRRRIRFPGLSPGRYYQVTNRLTSVLLAEPAAGPLPGASYTNLK
jgi:hypothetical protein